MKKFLIVLVACGVIISFGTIGGATVIDFEDILYYTPASAGKVTPVAGSVITDQYSSLGVIFGRAGVSAGVAVVRDTLAPSSGLNTVAGLDVDGFIPGTVSGALLGDIYFSFLGVTDSVSFTVGDSGGDTDIFDIRAYDAVDALVFNNHYENADRFTIAFGGFNIARVEVDFTGSYGYSLDDLTFNIVGVPEPATMLLLGFGIIGLAGLRRKLRKE